MEQQRRAVHNGWYHETQSSQHGHLPHDPHAALVQDRFLLGLDAQLDPTLRRLFAEHSGLLEGSRATYDALFPEKVVLSRTETLSLYDRLSSALTVAQVTGVQPLCSHYAARLAPLSSPDASRESNIRQTHITQFARLLATHPTLITPPMLTQLTEVGLSTKDIVTFTQPGLWPLAAAQKPPEHPARCHSLAGASAGGLPSGAALPLCAKEMY